MGKKILNKISDFLSESSRASLMRLMSILMFFIAAFYLFFSFKNLMINSDEINMWMVILHLGQNTINFAFAFFPKLLQKKFEQIDINKLTENV